MQNKFHTILKNTPTAKPFSNGFVLTVDILLIISTLIFTYWLVGINSNPSNHFPQFLLELSSYVPLYVVSFLLFKSYQRTTKASIFKSHFKATCAVLAVVLISFSINYFYFWLLPYKWTFIIFILIHTIFLLVALTLFRMFLYLCWTKKSTVHSDDLQVPMFVVGNLEEQATIIATLKKNTSTSFNISGVLDSNTIDAELLQQMQCKALLVLENKLSKKQKWDLMTICMELNIQVYQLISANINKVTATLEDSIVAFQIQSLFSSTSLSTNKDKIKNQIKNKVILITGAAGSIGSELASQIFLFEPKTIILLDASESALHHLHETLKQVANQVELIPLVGDICNFNFLDAVFKNHLPTIVYHAAAYKQVPLMENQPVQAVLTNLLGTKICADLAIKYKVSHFVFISTDKAVNPSSIMGATKNCAEKYIQILNQDLSNTTVFSTTRFGNVFNSNGSVVPLFQKQIANQETVTVTHPEITRYFMTLQEACELVLEAGAMAKGGEVFIFNMGEPIKIIDLALKMIQLAGFEPYTEIPIKITGLRPGEKLTEELHAKEAEIRTTSNSEICIVQEAQPHLEIKKDLIEELIVLAIANKTDEVVSKIKEIVPEFKSLHSIY